MRRHFEVALSLNMNRADIVVLGTKKVKKKKKKI